MTTDTRATGAAETEGWAHGRAVLAVPIILAAFCTYLLIGILTMSVPPGVTTPGPKFFPTIIVGAGYVIAALLFVKYLRTPEPPAAATYSEFDDVSDAAREDAARAAAVPYKTFSDWTSLAWAIGGFLAFGLLLNVVGWIVGGALLFWCVARAMGSLTPVRDVIVALMMSSLAYLAFDVLLGLNLPSGILGGL